MSKNLIGLSNNISSNLDKIKVWARSFKKHCPDGHVTLLCANASQQEIQACSDLAINTVFVDVKDHSTVNHQRLVHIKDYLKRVDSHGYFLITDVFDVVFQRDPFEEYDFKNYEIYVSEEGVNVQDEPWNTRNITHLFPAEIENCRPFPIINSGIIGGEKNALIKLYEQMYHLCEHEATDLDPIRDQAALIVLLAKNQVPKTKIFKLREAWAVHCAVAGPTQFFEAWGFKNNLIKTNTPIPDLIGSTIKVEEKIPAMVHQFNRVPEWHPILTKEYIY